MSDEHNQEDMALPSSFLSKENEADFTNVIMIPHYALDVESIIDSYVKQSQSLTTKRQLKLLLQDLWAEAEHHGKVLEMIDKIELDISILQNEVSFNEFDELDTNFQTLDDDEDY